MKKTIVAEIISVGTELLLGEIIDTNASWIANQLSERGISLYRKTTAGDNLKRLSTCIKESLNRANIVILTGGLGPTVDDLTREAIAEVAGEKLYLCKDLKAKLQKMFDRRQRKMAAANLQQAMLIPSARPLANPLGTAFGWHVTQNDKHIFALPGPPSEMQRMWQDQVLPALPESPLQFFASTIHTCGLGESDLATRISAFTNLKAPGIGTYARGNGVDIRIAAMAETSTQAMDLVIPVKSKLAEMLNDYIYGYDEETLVEAIKKMLVSKKKTFCCMESVSGGSLAAEITSCPGISACFNGGIVAYTCEVKTKMGINPTTIEKYGVVSEETAREMAISACKQTNSDFGIATTGVAGPDSHDGKPPGTAWLAIANAGKTYTRFIDWPGSREMVISRVKKTALQFFWSVLKEIS